jgi:hypothetical protein
MRFQTKNGLLPTKARKRLRAPLRPPSACQCLGAQMLPINMKYYSTAFFSCCHNRNRQNPLKHSVTAIGHCIGFSAFLARFSLRARDSFF